MQGESDCARLITLYFDILPGNCIIAYMKALECSFLGSDPRREACWVVPLAAVAVTKLPLGEDPSEVVLSVSGD